MATQTKEDEAERLAGVPPCPTCRHHHHDVDKCKVCGHGGRVQGLPGPNGPQPAAGYFHTVVYDLLAESGPRAASIAALLRCVRSRVFVNELELPFMKEEDEFEGSSRHVLALIGDAPVAYVRWRPVPAAMLTGDTAAVAAAQATGTGPIVILLERLLTVGPMYRRRGFGKLVLMHALADAAARLGPLLTHERTLAKATMFVPAAERFRPAATLAMSLGMEGFGPLPSDPTGRWPAETPVYEFSIGPEGIRALLQRWSALPATDGGPPAPPATA